MCIEEKQDEDALLNVNGGTEDERDKAKRDLTRRYYKPLKKVVQGWLAAAPDADTIARTVAGEALMRLFKKVEEDLGAVQPENRGVWRLLMKIAIDKAKDELEWLRRHQPPDEFADEPPERCCTPKDDPVNTASNNEELSRVLKFAETIPDLANRMIFMFDLVGARGSLKKSEKQAHDNDLLQGLQQQGHTIYSRDALRKRRERLLETFESFFGIAITGDVA